MEDILSGEELLASIGQNQKSLTLQRIAVRTNDIANERVPIPIEISLVAADRAFTGITAKHSPRALQCELQCELRGAHSRPKTHETLLISTSRASLWESNERIQTGDKNKFGFFRAAIHATRR